MLFYLFLENFRIFHLYVFPLNSAYIALVHIFDLNYNVVTTAGVNKHLKQILKTLKIHPKNMTSTGLRHTYCSIMLAMGVDIWAVSKLMGHRDIKQITETYGHLIKEKADIENNKVRAVLTSLVKK